MTLIFLILFYSSDFATSSQAHSIQTGAAKTNDWEVVSVQNNIIHFKNNQQFKTPLYELKYLGQLKTQKKIPYLILSGRGCNECDENISIYIHSPSDGEMGPKQKRYSYPGKEINYEDGSLLYEARMFFGHVLQNVKNGVIWYQNSLMEDRSFRKSIYLIKLENDVLSEQAIESGMPDISETLKLARLKECKEVKGIEYSSEP